MSDKYYVRNPNRIYVSQMSGIRTTDILLVYQYASGGSSHKLDAEDTARRVVILLNAFDGVPTNDLSRLTMRAAENPPAAKAIR